MVGDAAFEVVEIPAQLFEREAERENTFDHIDRQVTYKILVPQNGHFCGIFVEGRIEDGMGRHALAPNERHAAGA
jgi:hypothetical protein